MRMENQIAIVTGGGQDDERIVEMNPAERDNIYERGTTE